ncbi:MAG: hypothetical protein QOI95_735 [Acidimicrobiaceae bacterium]|jgi:hypothetical protein
MKTPSSSAFVGRVFELTALRDAWAAVQSGERRAVIVGGEPGVGKTSVVATFAAEAHRGGATVLLGRCDENLNLPYQPFAEAVRAALDTRPIEELAALRGAGELARLVPDLHARVPGLSAPLSADPGAERWALFEAVVRLLEVVANDGPVVLVLDDIQWASTSTLQLIRHVLRSERTMRLLVVATFRDGEAGDDLLELLADLRLEAWATRLRLGGLAADEVADLVAAVAGHELDAAVLALANVLHREANGNPFFISELLRHLVETGALYQDGGRWTSVVAAADLGLPESVRDVVADRAGRLSETARRVLSVAALIGQSFSIRVLELVPSVATDADGLLDALEEALDAGLIRETQDSFEFAHAIVRQALVDEFGSTRRIRLHRDIGDALERHPDAERHLEALAYHFAEAAPLGGGEQAARYAIKAGKQARDRAAYELALEIFERGVHALDDDVAPDLSTRCELLIELADTEARLSSRDSERVRATIGRAAADAKAVRSARLLTTAVTVSGWYTGVAQADTEHEAMIEDALALLGPDDDALRGELLAEKAFRLGTAEGRIDEALLLSEEAAELTQKAGSQLGFTRAMHARAGALLSTPRVAELADLGTQLLTRATDRSAPYTRSFALTFQASAALMTGDRDAFDRLHGEVSLLAAETRSWYARYTDTAYCGSAALMDGRWDDAQAADAALIELAGEDPNALNVWAVHQIAYHWDTGRMEEFLPAVELAQQANPGVYGYRTALAMAYGEIGCLDEARAALEPLLHEGYEVPRDQTWSAAVAVAIDAVARIGDKESATILYDRLAEYSGLLLASVGAMFNVGAADRFLGMAATVTGNLEDAERHFAAAVALEDKARCRPHATRTRMWFGRMLLSRDGKGDTPQARVLLQRAHSDAEAMGMKRVAAETAELLTRS